MAPSLPPPCIAAINDDATFLTMLAEMLTLRGYACYPILYAELDGGLADLPTVDPAAILLDVRMGHPEEGWVLRERLKRDRHLRAVPLIMCSADQRALEHRADELAAAGDTVLPKPFALDDLIALLARVVAGDAST